MLHGVDGGLRDGEACSAPGCVAEGPLPFIPRLGNEL